jgi:hypothetical protein
VRCFSHDVTDGRLGWRRRGHGRAFYFSAVPT